MASSEVLAENIHAYQELNPPDTHTVILIGGATEGIASQQPFAEALLTEGFRVVSYDYVTSPTDNTGSSSRYLAAKVNQAADVLKSVANKRGKVTLFGHSLGTIIAIEAALRNPEGIERIILANPAGLFEDSFPRLAGRFALETVSKTTTLTASAQIKQKEAVKYMAKHPISYIGDAVGIAQSDIRGGLIKLQEAGVEVDLLLSAKDRVFPWRLQQGYFIGQDREHFDFNSVSMYFHTKPRRRQHRPASNWEGHDQNLFYPEQTARLVSQLVAQ